MHYCEICKYPISFIDAPDPEKVNSHRLWNHPTAKDIADAWVKLWNLCQDAVDPGCTTSEELQCLIEIATRLNHYLHLES